MILSTTEKIIDQRGHPKAGGRDDPPPFRGRVSATLKYASPYPGRFRVVRVDGFLARRLPESSRASRSPDRGVTRSRRSVRFPDASSRCDEGVADARSPCGVASGFGLSYCHVRTTSYLDPRPRVLTHKSQDAGAGCFVKRLPPVLVGVSLFEGLALWGPRLCSVNQ